MHYKNLAFAALAGIVLLSSCVKDLETKSVTDIRNAKLEEIKSQTALNNAKAASEKVLSEAEAQLKAAQAEAQKAQAEYIKAQAAYQQAVTEGILMDNQLQAAQLEADLIQAEISKAQAQAQLERLAMDLEKELLKAQKELLEAQAEYKSGLATDYANATISLLTAQNELVQLKVNLTSAEEGLVDLQTTKEKQIAANNELIAAYEKIVAAYRENMGMTEEELAAKFKELNSLCLEKFVLFENAFNSYADSGEKLDKARTDINEYLIKSPYVFDFYVSAGVYSFSPVRTSQYANGYYKYSFSYNDVDGNNVKVPVVSIPSSTYEFENYFDSFEGGKKSYLYYSNELRTYGKAKILDPNAPATVAAAAKEVIAKQHESNVAGIQTNINKYEAKIAAAEKAVSEYDDETKALYEEKAELEEKVKDAYNAMNEANKPLVEYTSKNQSEISSAISTYNEARNLRYDLNNKVQALEGDIVTCSSSVEVYEEQVANYTCSVSDYSENVKTKTTAVTTAQKAYDDQLKVVNPLLDKKDKAYAAYREKYLAYLAGTLEDYTKVTEAETAYYTARDAWATEDAKLQNLKTDLTNAQSSLQTAEDNLNRSKRSLANAEYWLGEYKSRLAKATSDLSKKKPELEAAIVAEKTAKDAYDAVYYAQYSNYNKELAALWDAYQEAGDKYNEAVNQFDEVSIKINTIESTYKDVAYSYEDLTKETTVTENYSGDYSYFKNNILAYYPDYVEYYKNQLAEYNTSFDEFNKQVDECLAKLTSIVESEAAYSADIDALNELENTTFELYKEYKAAEKAYNDVNAEITALESKADDIDIYLASIEYLKKDNADITTITSKEQAVARIKTDIANKELEIEVLKKKVEDLKAALDAALAEEENTTEE